MLPVVRAEPLGAQRGRRDRHALRERLDDLESRPAPEAQRDDHQVGAGELGRDVGHPSDEGDLGRVVEPLQRGGGHADQPDPHLRHQTPEDRQDLVDEEAGTVGVRWVAQGAWEDDGRGRAHPDPPDRGLHPPVRVGHDLDAHEAGPSRPGGVELAADDRRGAAAARPGLQAPPAQGLRTREHRPRPPCQPRARPRSRGPLDGEASLDLAVLEVVDVEDDRDGFEPAGERPALDTEVPDEVVGTRGEPGERRGHRGAVSEREPDRPPADEQRRHQTATRRGRVVPADVRHRAEAETLLRWVEIGPAGRYRCEQVDGSAAGQPAEDRREPKPRPAVDGPRVLAGDDQGSHGCPIAPLGWGCAGGRARRPERGDGSGAVGSGRCYAPRAEATPTGWEHR